jgi:trans-aconitate methyltransferase
MANGGAAGTAHYGDPPMDGYETNSYGEAFADVYDDWYGSITDVDATVDTLVRLAERSGRHPIVELGVGTARLAIPLASALPDRSVYGIDASRSMLTVAASKPVPPNLHLVLGDMGVDIANVAAGSPLGLVFVAFNTFFNLATSAAQQACFDAVAARLAPGGSFVVEAFVPDDPARRGDHIEVKAMQADRVVLSITRYDGRQHVEGQFVELSESGGVRLRPWSIRYLSPAQIDAMAAACGLTLRHRWESFSRAGFTDDSARHVSVYARSGA